MFTVNKALAKVISEKGNRGTRYGLEIPCEYHLYGPKPYIDKMKLVDSLTMSGLADRLSRLNILARGHRAV